MFSSTYAGSPFTVAALSLFIACLAACGGGGSESPAQALATTPVAAVGDNAVAPTVPPLSPVTPPEVGTGAADSTATGLSDTVGTARALNASASVSLEGLSDLPTAAATLPRSAGGRLFYLNDVTGADTNDGRSGASGGSGSGPWRTLARLMKSDLAAGDSVELACGGVWHEMLRLPANGTPDRPIFVSGPASGCRAAPAIDGGVALPPAAWVRHRGNVFKAAFGGLPLQVLASTGVFTPAHHPNLGDARTESTSPYLALAADSSSASSNGRDVTVLTTGPDLVLPAEATLGTGARVRVRTNPYVIDDLGVNSFDGGRITLDRTTTYPVAAGWGYLLLGQLWMLDSAGEWHHDAAAKQLYAWMPDNAAPVSAITVSVLPVGIDLQNRSHVVVEGLAVRNVGVAVDMRRTTDVRARNLRIEDVADFGVLAAGSSRAFVENSYVARTGGDAITGWGGATGELMPDSLSMTVSNNVVRDSGVLMRGELPVSLPRRSLAAIFIGTNSVASGNSIVNAAYIGILAQTNNLVEDNFIYGACSVQDDCGAIYTGGAYNRSTIRRNTVLHSRGSLAGQPTAQRGTSAQGIYIDDEGADILVEDNTVINADFGIQLHNATRNTLRGNRLFGNRSGQIWMQEDSNRRDANGDMTGNVIERNQIAGVSSRSLGYVLTTRFASTAAFGRFEGNRFHDRSSPVVAYISSSVGGHALSMGAWRNSNGHGSTQPVDANGSSTSLLGYAAYQVAGTNLIANGDLREGIAGWGNWNQTAPEGRMIREACPAGNCLRYVPGGSTGVLNSPGFALQKGAWYRISVDVSTETDNQTVPLVVRIGSDDYASVSDRRLSFVANRTWARHTVIFQATRTLDERAARIDIDGIEAGKSISLAGLELVPITPDALAQVSGALVNASAKPINVACPFAAAQATLCTKMFNLADDQLVRWPLTIPARGAAILYAQEISLVDGDHDGIPDSQDRCPNSTRGVVTDASGCQFVAR